MAGDLITEDWMMEFAGYAIGGVEPVSIIEVTGLEDLPSVEQSDIALGRAHGLLAGPMFGRGRTITLVGEIEQGSAASFREAVDAFRSATSLRSDEQALAFRIGMDDPRMVYARVVRRTVPNDQAFSYGLGTVGVQWVATDPRIYSTTLQSASTTPGSSIGGLSFPHGFPHGFGTATSGTLEVTNDGNAGAPWTATLTGPLSSPRIRLLGLDGELAFSGFDLAAGQTLTLDSLNRSVLLEGTASRYGSLSVRDWFEFPPGGATVGFSASSGAGSLSMTWRDTWL